MIGLGSYLDSYIVAALDENGTTLASFTVSNDALSTTVSSKLLQCGRRRNP
jgi:lambda repressor-like predicted transcriptional regulator